MENESNKNQEYLDKQELIAFYDSLSIKKKREFMEFIRSLRRGMKKTNKL